MSNARAAALESLTEVLQAGRSADTVLTSRTAALVDARDAAFCRALVYGVLREHRRLAALRDQLLRSPLKPRDQDIALLIELGLYQLMDLEVAPHAAVSETVAVAHQRGKSWAAKLINAVLRRFQRERVSLLEAVDRQPAIQWSVPHWLLNRLKTDWPEHWAQVLEAQNTRAPMTLRVNRRVISVSDYQAKLAAQAIPSTILAGVADALVLERPVAITALPGFDEGLCSVQDGAAQLAAAVLSPKTGSRVLDACAAPGGKAAHLLEHGDINLLALDEDSARLDKVEQTFTRLGLKAAVKAADAGAPDRWWDGEPFDAILLDAPCSGSGVIRRHPDIKWLRRADDLPRLQAGQKRLLKALWPLLAPGGKLLYATCSILREENEAVIEDFMAAHADAEASVLALPVGRRVGYGHQILTGEAGVDGFYYACLTKNG